jgi:hypothetical protein
MGVSLVLENLALVAVRSGFPERGEPLAREALHLAEEVGFPESARTARIVLSRALADLNDLEGAQSLAVRVCADDDKSSGPAADIARLLAELEFRKGHTTVAARLIGSASTAPGLPVIPLADRAPYETLVVSVTTALGAEFDAHFQIGRAQSPRAIVSAHLLRE